MAKYKYVQGAAHEIVSPRGDVAQRGSEDVIELRDEEVIDLSQRGVILEPADGRKNMPTPERPSLAYINALKTRATRLEDLRAREAAMAAEAEAAQKQLDEVRKVAESVDIPDVTEPATA